MKDNLYELLIIRLPTFFMGDQTRLGGLLYKTLRVYSSQGALRTLFRPIPFFEYT